MTANGRVSAYSVLGNVDMLDVGYGSAPRSGAAVLLDMDVWGGPAIR